MFGWGVNILEAQIYIKKPKDRKNPTKLGVSSVKRGAESLPPPLGGVMISLYQKQLK